MSSTAYLDPASDGTIDTSVWFRLTNVSNSSSTTNSGTYASKVNKGIRQPSSVSTSGSGIEAEPNDSGTYDCNLVMSTTSFDPNDTVTAIKIWFNMPFFDNGADITAAYVLSGGGGATSSFLSNSAGSNQWVFCSFTGLNITNNGVSGMKVTLRASNAKNDVDVISAVYVELTYTPAPSGDADEAAVMAMERIMMSQP